MATLVLLKSTELNSRNDVFWESPGKYFTEEPIKPLIVRPWYFKIKLYFANCVQEAKDIKTFAYGGQKSQA